MQEKLPKLVNLEEWEASGMSALELIAGSEIMIQIGVCQIRGCGFKKLCFCYKNDTWFVDMVEILKDSGRSIKSTKRILINKFGKSHVFEWVNEFSGEVLVFISQDAAFFLSDLIKPTDPGKSWFIIHCLRRAENLDFDFDKSVEERMAKRQREAAERKLGVFKRTQIKLLRKLSEIKNYILAHIRVEAR